MSVTEESIFKFFEKKAQETGLSMPVREESIFKFFKKKAQELPSSSPILKPQSFFWDRIIFSFAFAIFGLSISGIIVEVFKLDDSSLACYSSFENQAQYTYINSYCHKHLPNGQFFPLVLVAHAALLVLPHYIWKVFVSTEFDSFFSHVARIEIIREGNTRKYSHHNYRIVSFLRREFGGRTYNVILLSYLLKLAVQLVLFLLMFAVNMVLFREIDNDIIFECSDDNERNHWQVFGNVTCANPRKLFTNILVVTDCVILLSAAAMLLLGMFLCFCLYMIPYISRETYKGTAQFCYDSCIDPQYHYELSRLFPIGWFGINDDFSFLLASLNLGLRRVFKTILVENIISQISADKLQEFDQSNYVAVASDIPTM